MLVSCQEWRHLDELTFGQNGVWVRSTHPCDDSTLAFLAPPPLPWVSTHKTKIYDLPKTQNPSKCLCARAKRYGEVESILTLEIDQVPIRELVTIVNHLKPICCLAQGLAYFTAYLRGSLMKKGVERYVLGRILHKVTDWGGQWGLNAIGKPLSNLHKAHGLDAPLRKARCSPQSDAKVKTLAVNGGTARFLTKFLKETSSWNIWSDHMKTRGSP